MIRATILALALLMAACSHTTVSTPTPPTQSVDQQMAGWLLTIQTGITASESLVPANPELKAILNKIIPAYNVAETGYQAYHTAITGGATPDPTALAASIQQLVTSITAIQSLYSK